MGAHDIYLAHRAHIDEAIAVVCRRHGLATVEAEDFGGMARLHFVRADYAVLRKFQGRSSIRTYLLAVVSHLYQDWRNANWGKWRASAEARRGGAVAVHLERLLLRDGLPFEQAYETLRTNFGVTEPRQTLEALAARFPARSSRRFVPESELDTLPAPGEGADVRIVDREAADAARSAAAALRLALSKLSGQERIIIKMHFEDDFSIADIARALHLDQKQLYRRLERLLAALRAQVERDGITADEAAGILERGGLALLRCNLHGERETQNRVRLPETGDAARSRLGGRRE